MSDTRGQSETLGFALILGLTVISVFALAVIGGAALDSAEQRIGVQSAEHAMSQFDSRVAMVGLGRSDTQTVNFGQSGGGTYSVEPGTGWIRIDHYNYSGTSDRTIYNRSLGSVTYQDGQTEIAYQGGGVWRKQDGGSVMVSPPEFHYRGATLTLPVLRVEGEGRVSGNPIATLRSVESNVPVYPNATATYNGSGTYRNPIGTGRVTATVHSEYYEAWADYFQGRTDGEVIVDHENETATMQLIALGTYGDFDMPLDGNSITLRGLHTHQIGEFTITLFHDQDDNAKFDNLDWSLHASSGNSEFEINVVPMNKTKEGDKAKVTMYYTETGSDYEGWVTTTTYEFETEDVADEDWNGDGDEEDKRLIINLTSEDTMEYTEVDTGGGGDTGTISHFKPAKDFKDPTTFSGHEDGATWEPRTYDEGDTEVIGNITSHYFAELGTTVDLYVDDQNQDSVEERISYGSIEYEGDTDYFLTYLHVTENEVNVTIR